MVNHRALADPRLLGVNVLAHCNDHAAGLVSADDRAWRSKPHGLGRFARRRPIIFEIAAAHARGFHLEYDFVGARCRIRKLLELDLSVANKHDAFHDDSFEVDGFRNDLCRPRKNSGRLEST